MSSTRDLINNPVEKYLKYRERLYLYGDEASFPEFAPVVQHIFSELSSVRVNNALENNQTLILFRQQLVTKVKHLNILIYQDFDKLHPYPYIDMTNGAYPYRETIRTIVECLGFFDILERLDKKDIADIYHMDRYAYHLWSIFRYNDALLWPTIETLDYDDFLKTRCIPLGFLGISTTSIYFDGRLQSPLEFFYHDVNHARRLIYYLDYQKKFTRTYSIYTLVTNNQIFMEKLLSQLSQSKESQTVKDITKTILFEILHEFGTAPNRDMILLELARDPGSYSHYEHMLQEPLKGDQIDLESIRLPNGNVESGVSMFNNLEHPIYIRYYASTYCNALGTVYEKTLFDFYDEDATNPDLINKNIINPDLMMKSAKLLYQLLDSDPPPDDQLMHRIQCKRSMEVYLKSDRQFIV